MPSLDHLATSHPPQNSQHHHLSVKSEWQGPASPQTDRSFGGPQQCTAGTPAPSPTCASGAQEASLSIPQALRRLGQCRSSSSTPLGSSQALPSALRAHTKVLQQPKGSTHPTFLSCSVTLTGTEAAFSCTHMRNTAAFPPQEVSTQVPKGQPKPARKATKEMKVLNKIRIKQFQFREQ